SRPAVTEASKYRQAERTWIPSRSETAVICFSIVPSTAAGARVTPRPASSPTVRATAPLTAFVFRTAAPQAGTRSRRTASPASVLCGADDDGRGGVVHAVDCEEGLAGVLVRPLDRTVDAAEQPGVGCARCVRRRRRA